MSEQPEHQQLRLPRVLRTSYEARQDPNFTGWVNAFLASDGGQEIMAILASECPAQTTPTPLNADERTSANAWHLNKGFLACLSLLQSLGRPVESQDEPSVAFQDPMEDESTVYPNEISP